MSYKISSLVVIFASFLVLSCLPEAYAQEDRFKLPPLPPAEEYGNILISRNSIRNGVKPVAFSHWQHRTRYTCRVCHSELEFNMKANTTEITELGNRKKRYCGACHNGKISFRPNGNCEKCHTGDKNSGNSKFSIFDQSPFPRTSFGNNIDWVESMKRGLISPATYLKNKSEDMPFDKTLMLTADWNFIAPSVFSHKVHTQWLDCNNCHPDIFNIKKKSTENFSMAYILRGAFCGACHLKVAFPIHDCQRCHTEKKEKP